MYKVIVNIPMTLNLLFNFSKQASTVVASKTSMKFTPPLHLIFSDFFATFKLLGYISYTTPISVRSTP